MNVIIVGAGALGSLLAALIGGKGVRSSPVRKLTLVDHDTERAAAVSASGISVEGAGGAVRARVPVVTDCAQLGTADLIILCVKSYDTRAAMERVKAAIGNTTRILTLQNGIGNIEIIAELSEPGKVIGGVTMLAATLQAPGQVVCAGRGETVLGRLDGRIPVEMRAIRRMFQAAGLPIRISRDIKGLLWSKLIINVGINALSAVTRLQNGKLLAHEGTRQIMRDAVTEAVRVAKRKRIKLIYDDPLAKVEAVCEATAVNQSSMLQDILRGRRTEIDFLNGVIVRHAKESNIPVPVNSVLVNIIRTIEVAGSVITTASGRPV